MADGDEGWLERFNRLETDLTPERNEMRRLAAAFDEVLGMAQSLGGQPGMTGTLTIRYRRPTPLHTDLRFEATLDRTEGRKLFTSGRLHAGDTLCAEAEGLFIQVDFAKIAELM